MSVDLTDDEYRILCLLFVADVPVSTIRLFEAINRYPFGETGPHRNLRVDVWCRRNSQLEAAETQLRERGLTRSFMSGWLITPAGLDAVMRTIEQAAVAGGDR